MSRGRSGSCVVTSSPPLVCASASTSCSGGVSSPQSVNGRSQAWFRFEPPGTTSARARSRTPGISGTAAASTIAAQPLASSNRRRCPSSPKPVTSVPASTPASTIAAAAAALLVVMSSTAVATSSAGATPRFSAVAMMPRPIGFDSQSSAPGVAVELRTIRCGSTSPRTTMPYFGSGSVIECPPRTATPAACGGVDAALQHPPEGLARQVVDRPAHDVEREERPSAHRVHVRERVRGRDAAPVVRVIDDRREEVERRHDGLAGGQAVDRGVVAGVGGHEHLGGDRWQVEAGEHGQEIVRSELAAAARAVAERGETAFGLHARRIRTARTA